MAKGYRQRPKEEGEHLGPRLGMSQVSLGMETGSVWRVDLSVHEGLEKEIKETSMLRRGSHSCGGCARDGVGVGEVIQGSRSAVHSSRAGPRPGSPPCTRHVWGSQLVLTREPKGSFY